MYTKWPALTEFCAFRVIQVNEYKNFAEETSMKKHKLIQNI